MPTVVLTITIKENGAVGVTGPLENKLLCHGMLGMAAKAVNDFDADKRIQEAGVMPPPPHFGKFGGS